MFNYIIKDNKGSAQSWLLAIAFLIIIGVGVYALVFKNFKPKTTAKPTNSTTAVKPTDTPSDDATDPGLHQALTVNDIAKSPNVYEGKRVILLRTMSRGWMTDRAFLLSDVPVKSKNALTGTSTTSATTPILAIRKDAFALPEHAPDGVIALGEDNKLLHVEGTIRYFDIAWFENLWGTVFTEADKNALKAYDKKPVLIIEVIRDYQL